MNLDDLNFLPEWNDDNFDDEDEDGEEWKKKEGRQATKALYLKWRDTFELIYAFADDLAPDPVDGSPGTHEQLVKSLIIENSLIIGAKLRGAMAVDLYILKMENAAIIRTNALQLMEQVRFAVLSNFAEEDYNNVIQDSMDEFRMLFKDWVATFRKDDIEDDWGLFL